MHRIYHCLWIKAPIEIVYAALALKSGLAGWWTEDVDHDGSPDSISTFRFSSGAFNKMKIETIAPERIEWECVDGHQEWIGTSVMFQLRQEGNQVKLCFSHSHWREATEYLGECSFHWAYYMVSLQKFCETGEGTPNQK